MGTHAKCHQSTTFVFKESPGMTRMTPEQLRRVHCKTGLGQSTKARLPAAKRSCPSSQRQQTQRRCSLLEQPGESTQAPPEPGESTRAPPEESTPEQTTAANSSSRC